MVQEEEFPQLPPPRQAILAVLQRSRLSPVNALHRPATCRIQPGDTSSHPHRCPFPLQRVQTGPVQGRMVQGFPVLDEVSDEQLLVGTLHNLVEIECVLVLGVPSTTELAESLSFSEYA